jgi:hypothetical protein
MSANLMGFKLILELSLVCGYNRFGIADTKPDSVKELIYEATAYAMWKGSLIERVHHQVLLLNRAQDRR